VAGRAGDVAVAAELAIEEERLAEREELGGRDDLGRQRLVREAFFGAGGEGERREEERAVHVEEGRDR